jgi:hypothetical protein
MLLKVPELALRNDTAQAVLVAALNPPPGASPNPPNSNKASSAKRNDSGRTAGGAPLELGVAVMRKLQPDLTALPMRQGLDCRLGKEPAENLHVLSRKLRALLDQAVPPGGRDVRPDPAKLRDLLFTEQPATLDDLLVRAGLGLGSGRSFDRPVKGEDWLQPDAIPALQQLLQAESKPARLLLIELLAKIGGPAATEALARRAIFDLAADAREVAVEALRKRPLPDARSVLLAGLQYPWPPVAEHAAEALVALSDRDALPTLEKLAQEPERQTTSREVIKVNHLANCLMCHAPSTDATDLVRGRVPIPGQPIRSPGETPQYYEGATGVFIRADVTYLKQDFSVMQPVLKPGAWPTYQRYDYLVRERAATAKEIAESAKREKPSDHRQAILFAIAELSGK